MSSWKDNFRKEVLRKAKKKPDTVKNVKITEKEISAEVDEYTLEGLLAYNSPYFIRCTCPSKYSCEHEAKLYYYLEKNKDILQNQKTIDDIINITDEESLKKFLIKEVKKNNKLKENILKTFGNKKINKTHYQNKLDKILKSAQPHDFDLTGVYNMDSLDIPLSEFMNEDIENILNSEEYEFGCDLLCQIGDVLGDELAFDLNSWYDLAEEYTQITYTLLNSIYLDEKHLNKLSKKTEKVDKLM